MLKWHLCGCDVPVAHIAEGRPRWPMVDRRALDRAPRGVLWGRTVGEEAQRQGERRHEAGGKDAFACRENGSTVAAFEDSAYCLVW
jgi:hypothetical protein